MLLLLVLIGLSVLVAAVSANVWLFCFLGIVYSKGQVSDPVWKAMPKAGWVFGASLIVAVCCVIIMAVFFRD